MCFFISDRVSQTATLCGATFDSFLFRDVTRSCFGEGLVTSTSVRSDAIETPVRPQRQQQEIVSHRETWPPTKVVGSIIQIPIKSDTALTVLFSVWERWIGGCFHDEVVPLQFARVFALF